MVLLPVSLRKFKPAEKKSTDSVHYLPSNNNMCPAYSHPKTIATPHPAPYFLDQQSPAFLAPGTSFTSGVSQEPREEWRKEELDCAECFPEAAQDGN